MARFLEGHSAVERVVYPGLESHPQHELAAQQMSGYSGMLSVDLGDAARARALATDTRVFQLAESLGGVQSLISVPALQTHASVPQELLQSGTVQAPPLKMLSAHFFLHDTPLGAGGM